MAEQDKESSIEDNPLESINSVRKSAILNLVLEEPRMVSDNSVNLTEQLSRRDLQVGEGNNEVSQKFSVTEGILFNEYLLEKFSSFVKPHNDGSLVYQLEYILVGKNTDIDNLKGVVNRLIALRGGCNFLYLLQDNDKMAEAALLATALVGFLMIPALIDATKMAIVLAWSFAEALIDVRALLRKESVPLLKNTQSWNLSLANLPNLLTHLEEKKDSGQSGLSYQDYLRILLLTESEDRKVSRSLDMIENTIQVQSQKTTFKLDTCIVKIEYISVWENKYRFFNIFPVNYSTENSYSFECRQVYEY